MNWVAVLFILIYNKYLAIQDRPRTCWIPSLPWTPEVSHDMQTTVRGQTMSTFDAISELNVLHCSHNKVV